MARPLCPGAGPRPAQSQPAPGLGCKRRAFAETVAHVYTYDYADAVLSSRVQLDQGRHRAFVDGVTNADTDADTTANTDAASGFPIQLGKGRHRAFAKAGITDTRTDNGAAAALYSWCYCYYMLTVKCRRSAFVGSADPYADTGIGADPGIMLNSAN